MSLTAYGAKAQDAVTAAVHEIQRLDAMFSVGNTDSDVTTANMQGSATVSDETAYLVEQSLEISRKTDGAFDITIYPVMELWGFTTKNYKVPQADELQETLKRVSYENVSLKDHELVLKIMRRLILAVLQRGIRPAVSCRFLRNTALNTAWSISAAMCRHSARKRTVRHGA